MRIRVNGSPLDIEEEATVARLLERLALASARVAVAVNAEVVPRPQHGERRLAEGDEVEIIHAVAGG